MQIISVPEKEKVKPILIVEGKHIVGEFIGDEAGATLVVVGSMHGNEPSAVIAMQRMLPKLQKLKSKLKGRVYLLAGNTRAIKNNVRFIADDFNRHWTDENIFRNSSPPPASSILTNRAEDIEQRELLEIFERIFSTAEAEVYAMETSLILMPLYQKQGSDGFFLGREISPFWLWLSNLLRKTRIGNLMRFLPGVRQHPTDSEALIINTHIAGIFPLQVFHLLGFRKKRWKNGELIVNRRKHDTKSPFIDSNRAVL